MLQCVAVCCIVSQYAPPQNTRSYAAVDKPGVTACCSVLQCVASCCSVLQYEELSCSVLQCDAMCCGVLQCFATCVAVH